MPTGWVRIAAAADALGVGRSAPGRGAWVCSLDCFDEAVRRGAFRRALRREIPSTQVEALRARLLSTNF